MTEEKERAIETLKENLCSMCAYGSQNMASCDIRGCDNRDAIRALKQEEPKTGHWIYDDKCKEHGHCSECGYGSVDLVDGKPHRFCQNCGVKMVEPQKKEE